MRTHAHDAHTSINCKICSLVSCRLRVGSPGGAFCCITLTWCIFFRYYFTKKRGRRNEREIDVKDKQDEAYEVMTSPLVLQYLYLSRLRSIQLPGSCPAQPHSFTI